MDLELPEDVGSDMESSDVESSVNEDPLADSRRLESPRGPVHFMEIFSNPRVAPHIRLMGMSHGPNRMELVVGFLPGGFTVPH